jgi:uncharacterized membrane protein YphA (DoxX/SURF4 family)
MKSISMLLKGIFYLSIGLSVVLFIGLLTTFGVFILVGIIIFYIIFESVTGHWPGEPKAKSKSQEQP